MELLDLDAFRGEGLQQVPCVPGQVDERRPRPPYPTGSGAWLPVIAGIWLLIALLAVVGAPSFSRRLGRQLVTDEGFEVAAPDDFVGRSATA
ncbi:MAG TPA: hypothetical protein VG184_06415 [Acidimicrobiales bacterium]|nr:hypothetical protein [Acidimicrobiales bacterium]